MLAMDALRVLLVLALLPATGLIPLPGIAAAQIIYWLEARRGLRRGLPAEHLWPILPASLTHARLRPRRRSAAATGDGLLQTRRSLAILIGPALATPLLVAFGPYWALGINALSYLVSFATILAIAAPREAQRAHAEESGSFAREFLAGVGYFFRSRVLLALGHRRVHRDARRRRPQRAGRLLRQDNLHTTPALYGLLATAQGVGMLLGALLASAFAERIGIIRMLWGGLVLTGTLMLVYSRLTKFGPGVVVILLAGVPLAALNVAAGPMMLSRRHAHWWAASPRCSTR